MKIQYKFMWLPISIILFVISVRAQDNTGNVVYLKNGSVVKGSLVEIPDSTIKIRTSDGSIFVCNMTEVEKVEKDTLLSPRDKSLHRVFSIFGGIAIPIGTFSDPNKGAANAGYTFGVQLVAGTRFGFLINASYTSNTTTFENPSLGTINSSRWDSFLLLAGLKIGISNEPGLNFFFAPVMGVNFASSPNETIYLLQGSEILFVPSASSSAFAYGATIEADFKSITLGA